MIRNNTGASAFSIACRSKDIKILKTLVASKPVTADEVNSCDQQGVTCLMVSAQAGYVETVDLLIKHGVSKY